MFVVGLAKLSGNLQDELPRLAADLGMTAYDARMLLAPGVPALVLATPEKATAIALLGSLRERGHDALAFDTSAVVPSASMVTPRDVAVGPQGFTAQGPEPARLDFAEVLVLLRATHETAIDASTSTTQRKFSAGRAMLTGGLVVSKTKTQTSSSHAYDKQDVLYVYLGGGQRPWLLRESGTRYHGLGDRLAPTERANFLTMVQLLRAGAPQAVYDESLVGRKIPERLARVAVQGVGTSSTRVESSNDAAMDLLCHFVAMWHVKQRPPART